MLPGADPVGLATLQWFAVGTLLRILALDMLADAAVAVQKVTKN